jgi:hypothetical protein
MAKKNAARKPSTTGPVAVQVENPPESVFGRPVTNPGAQSIAPPTDPRIVFVQTETAGSSGTRIYAGYFSEEYLLNELQGTAAADQYDHMRRSDAKVKMCLSAVKTPIIAGSWDIMPATTENPEHKEHAEFVHHVLFSDMDKPFSKTEALSVTDFGHAVFEVTHKLVRNHPKWGDYIGLKSLGWRSPRSLLYWNLDPADGRIESIRQLITGDLERYVDLPGRHLLVASLEKEGDLYEGVSLLRSCYGAWKRKNFYLKLMALGIERNAVPTPYAEVPDVKQNTAQYQNLIASLQAYTSHEKSFLTYPANWKIGFLDSKFDPEKLKSAIDMEDAQMVSAFMANFLLLGSTQSGSRAVSMDQSEFFMGSLQYIADEALAPFNHKLIPEIVRMKYGPQDAYPIAKVNGISDRGGKELAESLKLLAESQVVQPDDELEEHTRRRYKFPKKSPKGVRFAKPPADMQPGDNVAVTDDPKKLDAKLSERVREYVKKKRSA